MAERKKPRKWRRGEQHHRATISDATVAEMRRLHERAEDPWGTDRIAQHYGLRRATVQKILAYTRRFHVPPADEV